jgi:hypothetical protein
MGGGGADVAIYRVTAPMAPLRCNATSSRPHCNIEETRVMRPLHRMGLSDVASSCCNHAILVLCMEGVVQALREREALRRHDCHGGFRGCRYSFSERAARRDHPDPRQKSVRHRRPWPRSVELHCGPLALKKPPGFLLLSQDGRD